MTYQTWIKLNFRRCPVKGVIFLIRLAAAGTTLEAPGFNCATLTESWSTINPTPSQTEERSRPLRVKQSFYISAVAVGVQCQSSWCQLRVGKTLADCFHQTWRLVAGREACGWKYLKTKLCLFSLHFFIVILQGTFAFFFKLKIFKNTRYLSLCFLLHPIHCLLSPFRGEQKQFCE